MANSIVVVNSSEEQALEDARRMIDKVKVAMVKIYYIFAKEDIQKGLKDLPDAVRKLIKDGVNVVVDAIKKIVDGMTEVYTKGYVVIALLKELPNLVSATEELLDEGTAREAKRIAAIAAFTAVFVDEKYKDVQRMLTLFAELLNCLAGKPTALYKPGVVFELTAAQLGFDPKDGPTLKTVPTPALVEAPQG